MTLGEVQATDIEGDKEWDQTIRPEYFRVKLLPHRNIGLRKT
jgi:hypothetical protein